MKAIKVTINEGKVVTLGEADNIGEVCTIPYDLDAVTLGQAQAIFAEMDKRAPAGYLEALAGVAELPDEQKWSEAIKEQTAALCAALCAATGIPAEALDALTLPQQRELLNEFECGVVLPLYNVNVLYHKGDGTPAQVDECTEFEFEGVRYVNTAVERDAAGMIQPNADQTTEEFCESNDLLQIGANPIALMHLFVAVVCRPAGEAYDERKARERAELFKRLPVKIALDCFFSFAANAIHTQVLTLSSLARLAAEAGTAKAGNRASRRGNRGSFGRRKRAKVEQVRAK